MATISMKGQSCLYKSITCQEGICEDCQIFLDYLEGKEELTCAHCGLTGKDVAPQTDYVGGQGYMTFPKCLNQVECWERWDKKNGIPSDFRLYALLGIR